MANGFSAGMARIVRVMIPIALVGFFGLFPGSLLAQDNLVELTPWGLEGTQVFDLAADPEGGIYVATRRGVWQASADKLPQPVPTAGLPAPCAAPQTNGDCNALSIAVDTSGAVYATIGSAQLPAPGGWQDGNLGLFRLNVGASSWERLAVPEDFICSGPGSPSEIQCNQIEHVAVGPDDSVYIIATGQHAFVPQDADALYRSTDGGHTWKALPRGTDEMPILDRLAIGPDGRVWIGGGYVYNVFVHFILTSGDGGLTWVFSKIDPSQAQSIGHSATDFAFHGGSTYITTVPAAGAGTEGHPVGVYRSDDGGKSWVQLTEDNPSQNMEAIAVASNGDIYHSQWGGIRRSIDRGVTWNEFAAVPYVFALDFDYGGTLWAGTENGLFRTAGAVAPTSEPPTRTGGIADGRTSGPGGATVESGVDLDRFKADCFASSGAYYELADGAHGCIFPDGSELDCSAAGSCQLADPRGILIVPPATGR